MSLWTGMLTAQRFGDEYSKLIDERIERRRQMATAPRTQLIDRVDELEADLARVCLLLRALTDLCIARGLCSADQLAQAIQKTDLLDGVADGKLDPAVMRPEGETPKQPLSPEEYFKHLEHREKAAKGAKKKQ